MAASNTAGQLLLDGLKCGMQPTGTPWVKAVHLLKTTDGGATWIVNKWINGGGTTGSNYYAV